MSSFGLHCCCKKFPRALSTGCRVMSVSKRRFCRSAGTVPSHLQGGEVSRVSITGRPRISVRCSSIGPILPAGPQRLRCCPHDMPGARNRLRSRLSLFEPAHRRPEFVMFSDGSGKELPALHVDLRSEIVANHKHGPPCSVEAANALSAVAAVSVADSSGCSVRAPMAATRRMHCASFTASARAFRRFHSGCGFKHVAIQSSKCGCGHCAWQTLDTTAPLHVRYYFFAFGRLEAGKTRICSR
jgi:hypothetical protein